MNNMGNDIHNSSLINEKFGHIPFFTTTRGLLHKDQRPPKVEDYQLTCLCGIHIA